MAQSIHKIIFLIYYIITANIMVCNKPVETSRGYNLSLTNKGFTNNLWLLVTTTTRRGETQLSNTQYVSICKQC